MIGCRNCASGLCRAHARWLTATAANQYNILLTTRLNNGTGNTSGPAVNFDPYHSYAWKFIDGSNLNTAVVGTFDPAAFNLVTTAFANPVAGNFSIELRDGAKDLYIVYTPTTQALRREVATTSR